MKNRDKVGLAYAKSYERLYDEDVQMMSGRQTELDRKVQKLTDSQNVKIPLPKELPLVIKLRDREYLINKEADDWYVYPSRCPHLLGPLGESEIRDGVVTCPWHGFKFDLNTGDRLVGGKNDRSCSLGTMPKISQLDGTLNLTWP